MTRQETHVKWTEQTIAPAGTRNTGDAPRDRLAPFLAELREHPGRWAELFRYPVARIQSARSRGANIKKRHAGTEYAVASDGAEAVLYLRFAPLDDYED